MITNATRSQTAINATLADAAGLTYRAVSDYNGADTLTVGANDGGNTGSGGSLTDSKTVAITVSAVNDGPILTVQGAQTATEDTDKVISGVSVSASNPSFSAEAEGLSLFLLPEVGAKRAL